MYSFTVCIADVTARVETIHARPKADCRDFLVECNSPDCVIRTTQDDIDYEGALFKELNHGESAWDGMAESYAVLRKFTEVVIQRGILLMHGAVISVDGQGFLFTGISGIGKTTHIKRWLRYCPEATVINGDKPFIRVYSNGEEPRVFGTPWAGKERLYVNTSVPLKSIVLMRRSDHNEMRGITFAEAIPIILQQVYRPDDGKKMRTTLELIRQLGQSVRFWDFQFDNYQADSFQVAHSALCD